MTQTLQRDMYSLRDPGLTIDLVTPPKPDPLAQARYSCVYWLTACVTWMTGTYNTAAQSIRT